MGDRPTSDGRFTVLTGGPGAGKTAAYAEHGYELIELPFAPVRERADFVLARR